MLDCRGLVQAPNAPRDQSQHPRARGGYDEKAAYEGYMKPEPSLLSGPGDPVDAGYMAPDLLLSFEIQPPSGGAGLKELYGCACASPTI